MIKLHSSNYKNSLSDLLEEYFKESKSKEKCSSCKKRHNYLTKQHLIFYPPFTLAVELTKHNPRGLIDIDFELQLMALKHLKKLDRKDLIRETIRDIQSKHEAHY